MLLEIWTKNANTRQKILCTDDIPSCWMDAEGKYEI
jgi:hypothetical protein